MTQNNIKIAITGGIGSGKSTVAETIAKQGYSVISCDEIYGRLLNDKAFLKELTDEFGDILTEKGELDRKRLSALVFTDNAKLIKLNEITHPAIMKRAFEEMSGEGLHFCEVPIFFENGFEKLFNGVIVVLRDKALRISAVTERDNKSENEVVARINNQFDYEGNKFEEYYVIHNNRSLTNLRSETLKIIEKIKKEYPYLA